MINLKINNIQVKAKEGSSVLEAASSAGFDVPAMCNYNGLEQFTSCMVCVVKDRNGGALMPSCAVKAQEGMDIVTEDEEIFEARKTALELLLSEHSGDCEAPCRIACPAFMNIPLMNRHIAQEDLQSAFEVVIKDIALPRVLGRICPAPCEGACKRKAVDQPVAVCLLKRFAADNFKFIAQPSKPDKNKAVAIIGAGPAGLAAAFFLQSAGIKAEVFDNHEKPGGSLRYDLDEKELDKAVLDQEIEVIKNCGVTFHQNSNIDSKRFEELIKNYEAVIVATGNYTDKIGSWGLENNGKTLLVNKSTYLTNIEKVFAVGNVNRSGKLAIRSLAQGKEVAKIVIELLQEGVIKGKSRKFNSVLGKLISEEFPEYLNEASSDNRYEPGNDGFSLEVARKEAARCIHCDCRKPENCKLRNYAEEYDVSKKRFAYTKRKPVKKHIKTDLVVYEPGKCIKCGICVRITAKQKEKFGFTFIGRGFDVEIGAPFNRSLEAALEKTAREVAEACPTGALCGF